MKNKLAILALLVTGLIGTGYWYFQRTETLEARVERMGKMQLGKMSVEEQNEVLKTLVEFGEAEAKKREDALKGQEAAKKLLEGCKPLSPEPGRYTPFKPPTSQYTWP